MCLFARMLFFVSSDPHEMFSFHSWWQNTFSFFSEFLAFPLAAGWKPSWTFWLINRTFINRTKEQHSALKQLSCWMLKCGGDDLHDRWINRPLTVDLLYALQVVQRQLEVVCVHVLIERSHDGTGIVGVLQTQRMTQLMDRHQEQIVTWTTEERGD